MYGAFKVMSAHMKKELVYRSAHQSPGASCSQPRAEQIYQDASCNG